MGRTERASRPGQGLLKRITAIQQQEGFGLVEVLIATAITATAIVMFLGTISTGSGQVGFIYERITAENLARSQLEYTKSQPYMTAPASYTPITTLPLEFTVTAEASAVTGRNNNIQKIIVTVYRNMEPVLVIEDFKVDR